MNLEKRISAFTSLGQIFKSYLSENSKSVLKNDHDKWLIEELKTKVKSAKNLNGWFTEDNINYSLLNWPKELNYNTIVYRECTERKSFEYFILRVHLSASVAR